MQVMISFQDGPLPPLPPPSLPLLSYVLDSEGDLEKFGRSELGANHAIANIYSIRRYTKSKQVYLPHTQALLNVSFSESRVGGSWPAVSKTGRLLVVWRTFILSCSFSSVCLVSVCHRIVSPSQDQGDVYVLQ